MLKECIVNSSLGIGSSRKEVVAYERTFFITISELVDSTLGTLLEWARENGLGEKTSKTELLLEEI